MTMYHAAEVPNEIGVNVLCMPPLKLIPNATLPAQDTESNINNILYHARARDNGAQTKEGEWGGGVVCRQTLKNRYSDILHRLRVSYHPVAAYVTVQLSVVSFIVHAAVRAGDVLRVTALEYDAACDGTARRTRVSQRA